VYSRLVWLSWEIVKIGLSDPLPEFWLALPKFAQGWTNEKRLRTVDRAMERRGDVLDVYAEPGRGQAGQLA